MLSALENDESTNIFELSDKTIELAVQYSYFLEELNNVWELFLFQDRAEYLTNCQVLLFLMLLSFNKTSFTQYHNETLQHLTLKVKSGMVSYEEDALTNFKAKIKKSFVYNISYLVC